MPIVQVAVEPGLDITLPHFFVYSSFAAQNICGAQEFRIASACVLVQTRADANGVERAAKREPPTPPCGYGAQGGVK